MAIVIRKDESFNRSLMYNLQKEYDKTKRLDTVTHVSDILPPPTCIRRAYYGRIMPELNVVDINSVNHFIRGQATEFAITKLANAGVSQLDVKFGKTVKGHPDIASSEVIYELKDTTSLGRLDFSNYQFRSYLRQLLYYMVMTNKERGIISIKYNAPNLVLQRRTKDGEEYLKYYASKTKDSPEGADPSKPGIEPWDVYLPLDDPLREEIKQEILQREELFQNALKTKSAFNLPRLPKEFEKSKCNYCPYKKICFKDPESESAIELKNSIDLLDKDEVVDFDTSAAPNIL